MLFGMLTLLLSAQMGMIDVQAMVWAFVAAWTPINPRLSLVKPNLKLCSKRIMVPIIEVVVLATVTLGACYFLMKSTDWYEQGEASASASLQVRHTSSESQLTQCLVDVADHHCLDASAGRLLTTSIDPDASCSKLLQMYVPTFHSLASCCTVL